MVSTTCGEDDLLRGATEAGHGVESAGSLFAYRYGRWCIFMDHDGNRSWRYLIFAPEEEMLNRLRRGTPRMAAVGPELEARLRGGPGDYVEMWRAGLVRLLGGATSDQIYTPDAEPGFLRALTYMMEKGTGQYWLHFR